MSNNTIRVFEAFAGYGSQSIALKRLNADRPSFQYEVVGISEIDKNAISAYHAIHGESTPNFGDIMHIDWSQVPCFDLLTYSFPCQDISSAGRQRGFSQGSGTRSSLLWACTNAIEAKHPKYLLMENVKALTQKKFAKDFYKWREWLSDKGYTSYYQILNAKEYGVPQNRERVFMVSILGEHRPFFFPKAFPLKRHLKDIVEDNVDESYYLKPQRVESIANTIATVQKDSMVLGPLFLGYTRDHNGKIVSRHLKHISNTIVASNHGHNGTTAQYPVEPMIYSKPRGYSIVGLKILAPTVTSSAYTDNNFLIKDFRIRKLTPRECFRLMDVSDSDIDKIQSSGISKTQQFKLAGNSIVVSCLYHVFRKMFVDLSNEQPGYVQLSLSKT